MATNEELKKRIESLEKEVQHLKAVLQYQMRNKKKWKNIFGPVITYAMVSSLLIGSFTYQAFKMNSKK